MGRAGQPARLKSALDKADATITNVRSTQRLPLVRMRSQWLAGTLDPDAAWARVQAMEDESQRRLLTWQLWPERIDLGEVSASRAAWSSRGLLGHVVMADLAAARAARWRGDASAAAAFAAKALPAQRKALLTSAYRPWLMLEIARCAAPADPDLAHRAWREGLDWVRNVARLQVPAPFRDGFLARNAVNRELLTMPDPGRRPPPASGPITAR